MVEHKIALSSFQSQGADEQHLEDGVLHVRVTRVLPNRFDRVDTKIDSFVFLPGAFRLPLRIDLTVRIDAPGLYLLLGEGRVSFGTSWSDNRRIEDIVEPTGNTRFFAHQVPMNEFTQLSVLYGKKSMQILVDGQERFFSTKERYMRSPLLQQRNDAGLPFRLTCAKHVGMDVKSLTITEYDDDAQMGIIHDPASIPRPRYGNEAVGPEEKPTFEGCISLLPDDVREEVLRTDGFLKALRPMRFKRVIEKHGNKITWVASDHGFSYAVHPSNDVLTHTLQWYILTNSKPELWHRKANLMEQTLRELAGQSPELAARLFANLAECTGCSQRCIVRTPYEFEGKRKLTCHGKMEFTMRSSDFEDARRFIDTVNRLYLDGKE